MIELLYDLVGLVFWFGTFAFVAWWLWSMRKGSVAPKRTPREEQELADLRAAIGRDQDRLLADLPSLSDEGRTP